jgi:hypothetical protein
VDCEAGDMWTNNAPYVQQDIDEILRLCTGLNISLHMTGSLGTQVHGESATFRIQTSLECPLLIQPTPMSQLWWGTRQKIHNAIFQSANLKYQKQEMDKFLFQFDQLEIQGTLHYFETLQHSYLCLQVSKGFMRIENSESDPVPILKFDDIHVRFLWMSIDDRRFYLDVDDLAQRTRDSVERWLLTHEIEGLYDYRPIFSIVCSYLI